MGVCGCGECAPCGQRTTAGYDSSPVRQLVSVAWMACIMRTRTGTIQAPKGGPRCPSLPLLLRTAPHGFVCCAIAGRLSHVDGTVDALHSLALFLGCATWLGCCTLRVLFVRNSTIRQHHLHHPEQCVGESRLPTTHPSDPTGAYEFLLNEEDRAVLPWIKWFQKFDLYSKSTEVPNIEELMQYYKEKIQKYFPNPVHW